MIEKEPITVVISEKGWIRALKGHISDTSSLTFKEGDALKVAFPAQTTDKILLVTTGARSTRWVVATSCPVAVAMANRCASWSTWKTTRTF